MGLLDNTLAWMDNKRRVAGRNVSDLWNDPENALSKTGANTVQTVQDLPKDPMNFFGGGMGTVASSATRMYQMGMIGPEQFRNMVRPGEKFMTEKELLDFEKQTFRDYLARQQGGPSELLSVNPNQWSQMGGLLGPK